MLVWAKNFHVFHQDYNFGHHGMRLEQWRCNRLPPEAVSADIPTAAKVALEPRRDQEEGAEAGFS